MSLETYTKEDRGEMREAAAQAFKESRITHSSRIRAESKVVGLETVGAIAESETGYIHPVGETIPGSSPGRVTTSERM